MDALEPLCGVIYHWEEGGGTGDLIRSLRSGDHVVVTTLARLAPTREGIRAAVQDIHKRRATIIETETSRRSSDRDQAIDMLADAVAELAGDSRALPAKKAREYGKLAWSKKRAKRMPISEAERIWRSTLNKDKSNGQCIALMPGWTERAAYREIGPRGLAKGRPRKQ